MVNYSNGKIYKIRSYQTDDVYIGSTTQTLSKRIGGHRTTYIQYLEGKNHYVTSYKIVAFEDAYIELVCLFPCNSKMELEKREGEEIRACVCVNKRIAGRTKKEYRADNREKIQTYKKQYRKVKIECSICGFLGRKSDLKRHQRTKKCKSHL